MFFNPFSANFMEIGNIYNSMKPIYQRIDWRKHLIPNHHSWISEYMDTHGVDFYAKTADIINEGWKRNKKQVVIAKFLRTPILISVPKEDYKDALHYCLKWFEHQELYEYCAIVRDYLKERNFSSNIRKELEKAITQVTHEK